MAANKRAANDEAARKVEIYIKKCLSEGRVTVRYYGGGGEVLVDGEVYAVFKKAAMARCWLKKMRAKTCR